MFSCFMNFKVDDFVNDLNDCNWAVDDTQLINLTLNSFVWNSFVSKFTILCDKHAPIKTVRFKDNMCPWLENRNDIFDKMYDRNYHHNKAIEGNAGNEHWNKYKTLRNQVYLLMKEAKKDYFTNEINESAGDSKKMWSTLQRLLPNYKSGVSTTLPPASKRDSTLANYLINISPILVQNCRVYNGTSSINAKFKFTEITIEQVLEELTSISSQKQAGLIIFV